MSKVELLINFIEKDYENFFFHTHKRLKTQISYFIKAKKWSVLQRYLAFLLSKNPKNVDFMMLYGLCLFMQGKSNDAIQYLHKSTFLLNQYHCRYHYIGAGLNHNKIVVLNLANINENIDKLIKRRDFLYPLQKDIKDKIDICSDMLSGYSFDRNLCIFSGSILNDLIDSAYNEYKQGDFKKSTELYQQAIEICDIQHFQYHCTLSLHFYLRGLIFENIGMVDVARYDYSKALEQDVKNPLNKLIVF